MKVLNAVRSTLQWEDSNYLVDAQISEGHALRATALD
jgi:hypothetical protein